MKKNVFIVHMHDNLWATCAVYHLLIATFLMHHILRSFVFGFVYFKCNSNTPDGCQRIRQLLSIVTQFSIGLFVDVSYYLGKENVLQFGNF